MSQAVAVLLTIVAIQAAVIVSLLVQRRRRARAAEALRESEERFRLMLDRAPVILWTARPDTRLDYLNHTCLEFTGLPLEKMRDEGWLEAVHPDDRDHCAEVYVPAFEARRPFQLEYRVRRADGVYRWLLALGVPRFEPDGRYSGFIGCDIDISERREAEHEIQHLAGRLIEAQDAERARVARDLHDDVSQQLAGLSIALSGFKRRMDEARVGDDILADVRSLHQRTTALAQNVRHLSHDLHPTVLRHAGLVAALTSYCAELERSHAIPLACLADGDFSSLEPETALCLYRIAQEALRNVIAHAGAGRAEVRLRHSGDHAEVAIEDDGKGFDLAGSLDRGQGLGLVSITERARLAGGTVAIASEPMKGTRVHARVPARARVRAGAPTAAESGRRELSLP